MRPVFICASSLTRARRRTAVRALASAVWMILLSGCATMEVNRHESVSRTVGSDRPLQLDYLVYLPPGDGDPSRSWPALFVLHGVAEVGLNLEKVAAFGPAKQVELGRDLPLVVVSPQLFGTEWSVGRVIELVDHCVTEYRLDPERLYLTGTSLGGRAVWKTAAARPELFAAIVPVAGWGYPDEAMATSAIPAWLFHGDADMIVPVSASRRMYELRSEAGGTTRLTVLPHRGHTIWDEVYGGDELYDWLLTHSRLLLAE